MSDQYHHVNTLRQHHVGGPNGRLAYFADSVVDGRRVTQEVSSSQVLHDHVAPRSGWQRFVRDPMMGAAKKTAIVGGTVALGCVGAGMLLNHLSQGHER